MLCNLIAPPIYTVPVTVSCRPRRSAARARLRCRWTSNRPRTSRSPISTITGYVNSGTFSLIAQWWNGDPWNGGTRVSQAPTESEPYSATFMPTPEPATIRTRRSAVTPAPCRPPPRPIKPSRAAFSTSDAPQPKSPPLRQSRMTPR